MIPLNRQEGVSKPVIDIGEISCFSIVGNIRLYGRFGARLEMKTKDFAVSSVNTKEDSFALAQQPHLAVLFSPNIISSISISPERDFKSLILS